MFRDGRLSIVLYEKGIEHLFQNTMLKAYNRSYISKCDIPNPTDQSSGQAQHDNLINLMEMVHDKFDPRFKTARKTEFYGIVSNGCVLPFPRSELLEHSNIINNKYVLCIRDPGN